MNHGGPFRSFLRPTAVVVAALSWAPSAGAQAPPTEPHLVEGACPFECCTYRDWTAESSFSAYAVEGDTTAVAFVVEEGETFTATTGNVYVTRIGIVEVVRPLHRPGLDSLDTTFEPGDTLYVLDYLGEGFYNVWYEGEMLQMTRLWWPESGITPENRDSVRAIERREPETEWWVEIRRADGRIGWIRMREVRVWGADACA